jgi:hypothetical protein
MADTYYHIVGLSKLSPEEINRFIRTEEARKKKRNLIVGILNPKYTDDPVERERRETIRSIVEGHFTYFIDYAKVMLYANNPRADKIHSP